jgi:mRNA-degrading endonuclease RelE of RelBE toxin-antitoxin system
MRTDILTHCNDNLYEVAYNTVIVNAHFIDKYNESIFKKTFILDLSDNESNSDKTVKEVLNVYANKFDAYILNYRVFGNIDKSNNFITWISE